MFASFHHRRASCRRASIDFKLSDFLAVFAYSSDTMILDGDENRRHTMPTDNFEVCGRSLENDRPREVAARQLHLWRDIRRFTGPG